MSSCDYLENILKQLKDINSRLDELQDDFLDLKKKYGDDSDSSY